MHCWCGVEFDGRTGHALFCTPACAEMFRAVHGGKDLTHRAA
jgi:DNA polymerase III epsilon subunit-like protein